MISSDRPLGALSISMMVSKAVFVLVHVDLADAFNRILDGGHVVLQSCRVKVRQLVLGQYSLPRM